MNKKSRFVIIFIFLLSTLFCVESLYFIKKKSMTKTALKHKLAFVSLTRLPDLAINSEVGYLRVRSLSSVGSIYHVDGSLREYALATFAISPSPREDR